MGLKVASTCCLQSLLSQPPSPSSSSSSSPSVSYLSPKTRRSPTASSISDRTFACQLICWNERSAFFGTSTAKLSRSRSVDNLKRRDVPPDALTLRRAISATSESFFSDEDDKDFARKLWDQTVAEQSDTGRRGYQHEDDQEQSTSGSNPCGIAGGKVFSFSASSRRHRHGHLIDATAPPQMLGIGDDHPDWPGTDDVEMKANSVGMPLLLRMIKKKKQCEEGVKEAGESASCSAKKAFSSMVFIIRELQSYTLQLRELLFYEDLQGILARVHREMHASFCWLFQQIFSCTPTLMVSVMLLLANFTVYSMANNISIAYAAPLPPPRTSSVVSVSSDYNQEGDRNRQSSRFHASSIRTFSPGKTASVGGGGGRSGRPVAGATDDGRSPWERQRVPIWGSPSTTREVNGQQPEEEEEMSSMVTTVEEEARAWQRIVDEAARMQAEARHEALMDQETLLRFVSPVAVEVERDDEYPEYFKTEMEYQAAVKKEPSNPLLLSNYAQFLYQVVHDNDRAEHYFKRAVEIKPADAVALSNYANFLWLAKNDLEAAEETYLEAIAADPGNTSHAANYAHFLWNTGGEDTCYPLDGDDENYEA